MAEQMKPSGIDWIGDIPESWKVRPLKYLATRMYYWKPQLLITRFDMWILGL